MGLPITSSGFETAADVRGLMCNLIRGTPLDQLRLLRFCTFLNFSSLLWFIFSYLFFFLFIIVFSVFALYFNGGK